MLLSATSRSSHFRESKHTAFFNCYPPHLATADSAIKYYLSVYFLSKASENFRKLYDTVKVCKCQCRFSSPTLPPRKVIKQHHHAWIGSYATTWKLWVTQWSYPVLFFHAKHFYTVSHFLNAGPSLRRTLLPCPLWENGIRLHTKWGKHRRNFLFCPLFLYFLLFLIFCLPFALLLQIKLTPS